MARKLEIASCEDCGAAFSRSADGGTKGKYCKVHGNKRRLEGLEKLYRIIEESSKK